MSKIYAMVDGRPIANVSYKMRKDSNTISTQNVVPDLSYTPRNPESIIFIVDGFAVQIYNSDFTVSGKSITWTSSDVNLDVGDRIDIYYESIE